MANTQHDAFDLIEGLHSRHMWHVLHIIFKYLNEESLMNSELTCKAWKAAICDSHPHKCWNMLFQQKIASSPLFKRFHFNFSQDSNSQLCSRKLLNKYQYLDKTLRRNWLLEDFTRDFADHAIVNDESIIGHLHGTLFSSFSVNDKFIAWYSNSKITIWNRHSLKIEEIQTVHEQEVELFDFECALYDDALIYSHDLEISIKNLTTKKTESYAPPCMEKHVKINELFAMNGFLVAAILKEETLVFHDVFIWKIKSNAQVEWENFKMIPNIHLESYELFIDHRYLIVVFFQPKLECVVRKISDFGIKETIKIISDFTNVDYANGYLFLITLSGDLMTLNVDSGVHKIVATNLKDSPTDRFRLRLHSDHVVLVLRPERRPNDVILTMKVKIWNIQTIINLDPGFPSTIVQPQFSFETSVDTGVDQTLAVYVDFFGLLFLTLQLNIDWTHLSFRTLNVLPICNFCKKLKKRLRRCGQCKSAKYCSIICQTTDWNHHKDVCKRISFQNFIA